MSKPPEIMAKETPKRLLVKAPGRGGFGDACRILGINRTGPNGEWVFQNNPRHRRLAKRLIHHHFGIELQIDGQELEP